MLVREGDKVVCNTCKKNGGCVGVIETINDWYGEPVVAVYFDGKDWDHCDREVFYLKDLKPVTAKDGKTLVYH